MPLPFYSPKAIDLMVFLSRSFFDIFSEREQRSSELIPEARINHK